MDSGGRGGASRNPCGAWKERRRSLVAMCHWGREGDWCLEDWSPSCECRFARRELAIPSGEDDGFTYDKRWWIVWPEAEAVGSSYERWAEEAGGVIAVYAGCNDLVTAWRVASGDGFLKCCDWVTIIVCLLCYSHTLQIHWFDNESHSILSELPQF
mgnify:CR=1 FL=1